MELCAGGRGLPSVAQDYFYIRHIIKYVKYYQIFGKHDVFLSQKVADEVPTQSLR